ncbi:MAG: hypothetical protein MJZ30_06815 [Paludibacteraceae bacterium]|nr:hypothetical protein [Paludibacteraceae bacterium]
MNLTFQKFRLLLLLTVLFCSGNAWAKSKLSPDFTAHWVSKLDTTTRLCDLSIPEAHDAATWSVITDYQQDQEYDEKTLFSQGVRSFDMRLYVKEGNDQVPCFSHGGDFAYNLGGMNDLKTMEDEIENHFPDPKDLEGEFMFLFFQWEGDSKAPNEQKLSAFNRFIELLVEKYGQDNFVGFRKDLTIANVQGRIILVAGDAIYTPDNIWDSKNYVPIAIQTDVKLKLDHLGKDYEGFRRDSKILGYGRYNEKIKSKDGDENGARLFEQNNYDVDGDIKKKSITYDFEGNEHIEGWFPYLKSNVGNKDCVFHKAQINSYYIDFSWSSFLIGSIIGIGNPTGIPISLINSTVIHNGSEIAGDDTHWNGNYYIGCNHHTYDLLKKYTLPYGFVRFDFIGEEEHDWDPIYGDKLLDLVLMNNMRHLKDKTYIQDLAISRARDAEDSKELLAKQGYVYYDRQTNDGTCAECHSPHSALYLGRKTTNEINEAITGLFVLKSATNAAPEATVVGPDGKNYQLISYFENITDEWKGDLNVDTGGDWLYLYATKALGQVGIDSISLVFDNDEKPEGELVQMYTLTKTNDNYQWSNGEDANLNSGAEKAKPLRMYVKRHQHKDSENGKHSDSENHWSVCQVCFAQYNIEKHTMELTDSAANNYHYYKCADPNCNHWVREACKAESYSAQGFGVCSTCHTDCDEIPAISKDSVLIISNPGQLYWFAKEANEEDEYHRAVLANDIDFAGIDFNEKPWVPIGSNGVGDSINNPFLGFFDGQGHVISGIECDGSIEPKISRVGLFGYVEIGTIRNVGIINSSFSGDDYVGSIAGELKNAVIENVFSTASTFVTGGPYCGGLFGEVVGGTIKYGFYMGETKNNWVLGPCYPTYPSVSNIYSPFEKDTHDPKPTIVPASLFANGYVCQMLNDSIKASGDTTLVLWGQELGKDTVPVFRGKTLYQYSNCVDDDIYTNDSEMDGVTGVHDFSEKVLSENAIDGLHSYVCKFDHDHLSDDKVIKNYDGSHDLELKASDSGYYVEELDLTDAEMFYSPVDFTAKKVNDSRIAANDTMTIILPFDVTEEDLNGTVYKLASFDGKNLYFETVDSIKANIPCVVSGLQMGEPIITTGLENVTIKASNPIEVVDKNGKAVHQGVYETTLLAGSEYDYYIFNGGQLVKMDDNVKVASFSSAVKLSKSESVNPSTLDIVLGDEGVTSTIDVEQTMTGKVNVYDVIGRTLRLNVEVDDCTNGLKPGVYVVNGKKVIIVK